MTNLRLDPDIRAAFLGFIVAGALLVLSACAPASQPVAPTAVPPTPVPPTVTPAATPTPAPTVKAAAVPLTLDTLKNAEYPTDLTDSKKVKLTDGKYEEPVSYDPGSKLIVMLDSEYAVGDINGDGVEDAAAVLVGNSGGTGVFYQLAAVLNDGGKARPVAQIIIGDRITLKGISIQSGVIAVGMVTQGPDDPLCCPTLNVVRKYRLEGNTLKPAAN